MLQATYQCPARYFTVWQRTPALGDISKTGAAIRCLSATVSFGSTTLVGDTTLSQHSRAWHGTPLLVSECQIWRHDEKPERQLAQAPRDACKPRTVFNRLTMNNCSGRHIKPWLAFNCLSMDSGLKHGYGPGTVFNYLAVNTWSDHISEPGAAFSCLSAIRACRQSRSLNQLTAPARVLCG